VGSGQTWLKATINGPPSHRAMIILCRQIKSGQEVVEFIVQVLNWLNPPSESEDDDTEVSSLTLPPERTSAG